MSSYMDPLIREVLKDGRMTCPQILDRLYPSIPPWDRGYKRSALLQRCRKLTEQGDLKRTEEDGQVYWELVA